MYTGTVNRKVSRLISICLHFLPPVNQLINNAMQLCYKQKLRKLSWNEKDGEISL